MKYYSVLYTIVCMGIFFSTSLVHAEERSIAKGLYTYGFEVETFRQCNEKDPAWIVRNEDSSAEYLNRLLVEKQKPYSPIFVTIEYSPYTGAYDDLGELEKDYNKHIIVHRIIAVGNAIPKMCK